MGWVSLGGEPLAVRGDARDPNRGSSHSDCGLMAMLRVDWLRALVGEPLDEQIEVPPGLMLELGETERWWFASSLIAIGIDRQTFTYQAATDVLTSMTAYVDDQAALSIRLSSVQPL
ncbi:MAG: hypothetical protein ACRD0Z_15375 [Acidimicrobiales bacterium]